MIDYASFFTGKTAATQAPATHLTPPKYRLLLVDDESGIVKALTRVFRQENYEVITAGSGKEALERLAEGTVHLVISDFMMPGMNGAQFLHEVKQCSPETIRIMLTGHANTADAVVGRSMKARSTSLFSNRGTMTTCAILSRHRPFASPTRSSSRRSGWGRLHIQPRTQSVVVRYRIDGVLIDKIHIPHQMHQSLVSRLKLMSELDISERRRPQDGRITVKTPMRMVDLRISTLPTINGEKVVMRILDRNSTVHGLEKLGFSPLDLARVIDMVARPQGIILAAGPTGSGKTTTLYALLQHEATSEKNYVTIEDPVEYYLDMAGQVLVREKIGLTFPHILRALLRQDPDVVLLGEIRDFETAEVAFHAALTGHLVYSTLHTNSAIATIARLFDLGLKPYVVATALEGVIAQRLVRQVCPVCREEVAVDKVLRDRLGRAFAPIERVYRGKGCSNCHGSGDKGRVGLYEVLTLDDALRDRIGGGASVLEIRRAVRKKGLRGIAQHSAERVQAGATSLEEILRVLGPQAGEDC